MHAILQDPKQQWADDVTSGCLRRHGITSKTVSGVYAAVPG